MGAGGAGGGVGGEGGGAGGVGGGAGGEGGGAGGEGGMGGGAGGEGGGMGGAGGGGGPCDGVVCDPGDRCNPVNGVCEAPPAGACEAPEECPDGECLADLPGGFCLVACADDAGCGPAARCLAGGNGNLCFDRCDDGTNCREGWVCADVNDANGQPDGQVCLPDCRVNECGRGQTCNEDTGLCEETPLPCPYPCQAGEQCREGRCVRDNGTCVTDYHCEANTRQCHQGRCVAAEFTECQGAVGCDNTQSCIPVSQNPADPGLCLFSCQNDEQCPVNKACYAQINACYFLDCGPARPGGMANGQVRGACDAGFQQQWPGTCVPLNVQPGEPERGFCFEAGEVAEGGVCNAQETGRDAASRAQQCAPGTLCFGDPDDNLDPEQNWAQTGTCARLCDPRNPACGGGTQCFNLGSADDPATPESEERHFGACLATDCDIVQNNCEAGEQCRTVTFLDGEGQCGPAGDVALGDPCIRAADCADHAICANAGDGPTCLAICNPADGEEACAAGQQCFNSNGDWPYGVCL
jgi:hypothetical protein